MSVTMTASVLMWLKTSCCPTVRASWPKLLVNSAAITSELNSSLGEPDFLLKKSISRVTLEMQDRSMLKVWGLTCIEGAEEMVGKQQENQVEQESKWKQQES